MSTRVLFLAAHFISLYLTRKELIEELTDKGYEVYLSLPESDDNKFFIDLGCKIVPIKINRRGTNPFSDFALMLRYIKVIKQVDPDIILSYEIKPNIYGAMANRFLKKPGTGQKYRQVCNITGTGAVFLEDDITAKLCRTLYRHSIKKAYLVFFQNTSDMEYFIKNKMVEDNVGLLPGSGVNLHQFTPSPLPDDTHVKFIFIARVTGVKGLNEYLRAASSIKKDRPDVTFYIAGFCEEEYYLRLTEEYEDRGVVEYLGFRKDINKIISENHCIVLPSHGGEGVPNVILEASAMTRPCIGSAVPGTIDAIKDGVTGYLFEARSAEDLERVMRKFLDLTYEEKVKMGLAGRERVERIFDRNFVIEKYMKEIESCKSGSEGLS